MIVDKFSATFWILFQFLSVLLFGLFFNFDILTPKEIAAKINDTSDTYNMEYEANFDKVDYYYPLFADQMTFLFIGFAFFLAILAKYQFAATSYAFWICALTLQWGVLLHGFIHNMIFDTWKEINLTLQNFSEANYASFAILITFGALLGKVSFNQITVITLLELITYFLNKSTLENLWNIQDIGGSIRIYLFGSIFGLVCTAIITNKKNLENSLKPENHAYIINKKSTLFSFLGMMFMWLFFQSVNTDPYLTKVPEMRERCVINTILCTTASGLGGIIFSKIFRGGRANLLDIQNSAFTGGICIAASAHLWIETYPSMIIGILTSLVVVLSNIYIQPFLEKKLYIHDTRGVFSIFFLPALIGSFFSMIAVDQKYTFVFGSDQSHRSNHRQVAAQIYCILVTFAISIGGAIFTGLVIRFLSFGANKDVIYFKEKEEFAIEHEELSTVNSIESVEDRQAHGHHNKKELELQNVEQH